jgi:hypothetical protein
LACDTAPPVTTGGIVPGDQTGDQQSSGSTDSTGSVSATVLEQLSLERINRARLRPNREAQSYGIALDEGVPGEISGASKQALALNQSLIASAHNHSEDMIARDYFAHNTPEGVSPYTRMNDAGYIFIGAGENLAWRGNTGGIDEVQTVEQEHVDLFVDSSIPDRGHRLTMLEPSFREVGIGIVRGAFTKDGVDYDSLMQTQDYGTAPNSPTMVLGVIYNDANSNDLYDAGEGVGNAPVTLGEVSRTTNAAGGYSFAVTEPGTYTLRFTANKSQSVTIDIGTPNIKVDFVSGSKIVVNLGAGVLN